MKRILFISLLFVSLASFAQPVQPTTTTYVRGLPYTDHSVNTSMLTAQLVNGGTISINCRSLNFTQLLRQGYRFQVVLQDADRPNGSYGVTVLQLRSVRLNGNMLYADVPFDVMYQRMMKNRNFYVTVFCLGPQPWHYLSAGSIQLR